MVRFAVQMRSHFSQASLTIHISANNLRAVSVALFKSSFNNSLPEIVRSVNVSLPQLLFETIFLFFAKSSTPIDSSCNIQSSYRSTEKLRCSICKPNWIDKDGNEKRGKTVILDLDAVASTSAAIKLLETVLTAVKER